MIKKDSFLPPISPVARWPQHSLSLLLSPHYCFCSTNHTHTEEVQWLSSFPPGQHPSSSTCRYLACGKPQSYNPNCFFAVFTWLCKLSSVSGRTYLKNFFQEQTEETQDIFSHSPCLFFHPSAKPFFRFLSSQLRAHILTLSLSTCLFCLKTQACSSHPP